MPILLTHIKDAQTLRQERFRVQERIKGHEREFKKKLQQLPGELAVAGASSVIPGFLKGKVTNTALNGGKFLIDKFFVSSEPGAKGLLNSTKKTGVIPLVKTVFKLLKGKF